jgi:hypothetical protein
MTPECIILHANFQKIFRGLYPGPPLREGATPSLHPPPARPSAVRVGASPPRLRSPKRRNLNPSEIFFWLGPWSQEQ